MDNRNLYRYRRQNILISMYHGNKIIKFGAEMGNSVSDVVDIALTPFNAISLSTASSEKVQQAAVTIYASSTSTSTKISQVQLNVDIAIDSLKEKIFQALKCYEYSDEDCHIITEVLIYAELRGNNQGIVKLVTGGLKPTCPTKLQIIQDLYKKYNPTKLQVTHSSHMFHSFTQYIR